LRGCNPKKVLVGCAEIVARSEGLDGKGIRRKPESAWPDLLRFKKTFTEPIPEKARRSYEEQGVDLYRGRAKFIAENRIEISGETVTGRHLFAAAGAVPRRLGVPGESHIATSEDFLDLDKLPETIVFVGGGYVSFELAHVAARMGARSTILHRSERVLKRFDADLVQMLVEASEGAGIDIRLNTPVQTVETHNGRFLVHAGKSGEQTYEADLVVHGAGRVADIQDLNLPAAGVETSKKGIVVNEYMQSVSNPVVYAGGDVVDTAHALTPTAMWEGRVAAHNMVYGNLRKANLEGTPSAVFTFPVLAAVGKLEEELRQEQTPYGKIFYETSSSFTSKRIGLNHSGVKVLVDQQTDTVLGAHLLGYHAEEAINVFAMAMRHNLTTEDLRETLWVYPSSVYDIKHLFD
jgi:glutathione reductase (NADPH)